MKKHPAFDGKPVDALDHENLPKRATTDKAQPANPFRPDAIDFKNPPKAATVAAPPAPVAAKVAALIIALALLLCGRARATNTSIAITNNTGGSLTFALYSTNSGFPLGFYTLTGLTNIPPATVGTLTGAGTAYNGLLYINTNNNWCYILSNAPYSNLNGATNALYLLTNGWPQLIRQTPPVTQVITNQSAFTNNQI